MLNATKRDAAASNNEEASARLLSVDNESTGAHSYNSLEDSSDHHVPREFHSQHSTTTILHSPSIVGPVANLCSATLGAGVLALPYALQQAGLIWGCILLILAGTCTLYSLQLLVLACQYYQVYTYEGIVQMACGKRSRQVTEISILLFCGGCAVAYIITVGDIVESLQLERNVAMVVVWTIAMVPLSLLKTMTSLQSASGVGIFSIFLLILVANIHFWRDLEHHVTAKMTLSTVLWPAHGMTSVLTACPLIIFAFSCQPNVCAIFHELPEKHRMNRVLYVAVSCCAMLYTSISMAAYLDFGGAVQPNVLQNYCIHHLLIQVAFVGMTIAVIMAFPLNVFPTRVTLEGLIWGYRHGDHVEVEMEDTSSSDAQEPLLPESYYSSYEPLDESRLDCLDVRHVGLTLGITSLALILAMVAPNISVVFGLLGGTTSSVIGFILPGMVGIKVVSNARWKPKLLIAIGVVIGIVTTAVTVYSTFVPTSGGTHNPCNATSN